MEWITSGLIGVVLFVVVIWLSSFTLPLLIIKIAETQHHSKRPALAMSLFEFAIRITRATDWMILRSGLPRQVTPLPIVLHAASVQYFLIGQYDLSAALDDERLALLEASSDLVGVADATMKSAVSSMLRGDLTRALQLSERGIPIIENAYRNSSKDNASEMDKIMTKVHAANLGSAMFSRAWILEVLRRYEEAEPIRKRALSIIEAESGTDSFAVTPHLSQLGSLYRKQKRYADAEPLLRRCLSLRENIQADLKADPNDKRMCTDLQIAAAHEELGSLLLEQGNTAEAAEHLDVVQTIIDRDVSPDNPMHAEMSVTIAQLRIAQDRFDEAKLLLDNAHSAMGNKFGDNNPILLPCLETLSSLHHKTGEAENAESIDARIKQICKRWDIPGAENNAIPSEK